ncbi:MAG: hypothetical protein ABIT71_24470 [Vicinamibacteraceae bacterium]
MAVADVFRATAGRLPIRRTMPFPSRPPALFHAVALAAATLALTSPAVAQGGAPPAAKPEAPPNPPPTMRVVRIDCAGKPCRAGKELDVVLATSGRQWEDASKRQLNELSLVIAGVSFPALRARAVDSDTVRLTFVLDQDSDVEQWKLLLAGQDRKPTFPVALAIAEPADATPVGSAPRLRFVSNAVKAPFEVRPGARTNFIYALLIALVGVLFTLGRRSNLLRDPGPEPGPGFRKPYSLARTQLAVWLVVITGSYLFIWTILGTTNPLNQTALILLGLAVATGITAGAVGTSGAQPIAALAAGGPGGLAPVVMVAVPVSRNFAIDLLTESDGITIYRLQMVVWTLALVWVFGYAVWHDLAMPTFDNTLLGLMGVSNSAYVGGKLLPTKV